MTSNPLHTISRKAAAILKRRGYQVVWSVSLRQWNSPETFVCIRGTEDILHVKLILSPNTLISGPDIAKFCNDEVRILRRLIKANPEKNREHYEVWVSMPLGTYSAIEVLPDMLIDQRSGAVLSQQSAGGVPA
jgi:hypothetical protein